jgi:poly-gamma-glutamate synthase PgsB/CapB
MLKDFDHRIHVNGIRGKSSVTRLIAAALREGKVKTLGKTTGTAARILVNHRKDISISRKEADIVEQKRILDSYRDAGYKAVVFECMAINPIYQNYLESKIMHSTIGVITNIREDHMDMLGETLPDIARSLSATIPMNGHLVTAETNEELLAILENECKKRNTVLHAVGNMKIGEKHMTKFKHFEYKANVAIALKVAQLVGIKRATALAGMHKALPDPGAFILKQVKRRNKTFHWANLFAINDRESFVLTSQTLCNKVGSHTKKAVILNNRHDRPERVGQFVDIAVNSVKADYIFTFGDYEHKVVKEVQRHSKKQSTKTVKVVNLGNASAYRDADGKQLLNQISEHVTEECLLLGAVNIHTKQSQALLRHLERKYAH